MMQRAAAEVNLSETAFVTPVEKVRCVCASISSLSTERNPPCGIRPQYLSTKMN